LTSLIREAWRNEDGLTSVEYALLLVLVVIVAITAWTTLGSNVSTKVTNAAGQLGS
jgi:pilus assembly protein Flp/PilA